MPEDIGQGFLDAYFGNARLRQQQKQFDAQQILSQQQLAAEQSAREAQLAFGREQETRVTQNQQGQLDIERQKLSVDRENNTLNQQSRFLELMSNPRLKSVAPDAPGALKYGGAGFQVRPASELADEVLQAELNKRSKLNEQDLEMLHARIPQVSRTLDEIEKTTGVPFSTELKNKLAAASLLGPQVFNAADASGPNTIEAGIIRAVEPLLQNFAQVAKTNPRELASNPQWMSTLNMLIDVRNRLNPQRPANVAGNASAAGDARGAQSLANLQKFYEDFITTSKLDPRSREFYPSILKAIAEAKRTGKLVVPDPDAEVKFFNQLKTASTGPTTGIGLLLENQASQPKQ